MSRVFISYRRGEHAIAVAAIYKELAQHFGPAEVFFDVQSIPVGAAYPEELRATVAGCEAVVVVIHSTWTTETDGGGVRLIDRAEDWVRREIREARAAGCRVIPVLLGDAEPLTMAQLPADIRWLAGHQACPVRWQSFGQDVRRLTAELERHVTAAWTPPKPVAGRGASTNLRRRLGITLGVAVSGTVPVLLAVAVFGKASAPAATVWDEALGAALGALVALVVPLGVVCAVSIVRSRMHVVDSDLLRTASPGRYRLFALPALYMALSAFQAVIVMGLSVSAVGRAVVPLVLVVFVAAAGWVGLAGLRDDGADDTDAGWPPRRAPTTRTACIRRTAALLSHQLRSANARLSRTERDQAVWLVRELRARASDLRTEAARGRWRWLLADHPWIAAGYAIWLAVGLGFAIAAVVPGLVSGARPPALLLPMTIGGIMAVLAVVTMEVAYRDQRQQRLRLADEIVSTLLPGPEHELERRRVG